MFPCTAVKDVFNLNQTVQAHVTPETLKQCEGTWGSADCSAYLTPRVETQMKDMENLAWKMSKREWNLTFWLVQQMSMEKRDYNYAS